MPVHAYAGGAGHEGEALGGRAAYGASSVGDGNELAVGGRRARGLAGAAGKDKRRRQSTNRRITGAACDAEKVRLPWGSWVAG